MSNYNSAEEDPMNGCGMGCLMLALPYIIIGILMFIYFAIKHNVYEGQNKAINNNRYTNSGDSNDIN